MPNASAAVLSPGSVRRDRSVQVHREARNAKAERERQIEGLLNRGISVAEIASRSGISIKHMRTLCEKSWRSGCATGAVLLSSGRLAREG
jgi:DNA-binding CsgD family transcriptional regulator